MAGTGTSPTAAPAIVAHRGESFGHVENTLPAFAAALAAGVDVVELDARVTADGVPVVLHDETLSRLWGLPRRLADLTAAEVAAIRVAGVGIPTLAEALDLFTDSDTKIMVDLPSAQGIAAIIAVTRAHPAYPRVVWSGEDEPLAAVRAADPGAAIYAHTFDSSLSPVMINLDGSTLVPGDVERARAAGLGLSVWTIDDASAIRTLIGLGVDSITTNRIDRALAVRAEPRRPDVPEQLQRFLTVAQQLGAAAMRAQRAASGFEIETKTNAADLVTEVDRAIERTVREVLAAEFGDHAMVGEEYGGTPGAGYTWYCDPVDGTTNFARGLPWSSFSLALAHGDDLVVGVVADPWRGELVSAVAGHGAMANGLQTVAGPSSLVGNVLLTELAAHRPWDGFAELLGRAAEHGTTLRVMGSGTLTLTQPALSRAAAAGVGEFHAIDHAAALLIAVEAGCTVFRDDGVRAGSTLSELAGHPVFVAAPGADDELPGLLKGLRS